MVDLWDGNGSATKVSCGRGTFILGSLKQLGHRVTFPKNNTQRVCAQETRARDWWEAAQMQESLKAQTDIDTLANCQYLC